MFAKSAAGDYSSKAQSCWLSWVLPNKLVSFGFAEEKQLMVFRSSKGSQKVKRHFECPILPNGRAMILFEGTLFGVALKGSQKGIPILTSHTQMMESDGELHELHRLFNIARAKILRN